MKTKNLLLKIGYIALQGIFLPLILWIDDLRTAGLIGQFCLVFAFYEVLVIGDALLYWIIFKAEK